MKDHPRMCGKKVFCEALAAILSGSPPHVREKVDDWEKFIAAFGITPACAGKSWTTYTIMQEIEDHPRMCGKKGKG